MLHLDGEETCCPGIDSLNRAELVELTGSQKIRIVLRRRPPVVFFFTRSAMRLAVGRFALVALVAAIGADMAEGMTETSGLGKAHKRAAILTRGADRTVKALSRPAMTRHFRQGRGGERRDRVAIKATAISGSQDEYYDVEEAPHLMEFLADIGRGADTSTSLAQQSPADIQALELDPLPVEGSLLSAETIERVAHLIFLVKIWQDQPRLHHLAQEVAGQLRNVAMYKQLRFVPPFSNVQAVQQEDALFWFWRFRDENLPVPFMTAVRASMSVEIELEELEMEAERMRVQYESGEVTLAGATEYFSELEQFT